MGYWNVGSKAPMGACYMVLELSLWHQNYESSAHMLYKFKICNKLSVQL